MVDKAMAAADLGEKMSLSTVVFNGAVHVAGVLPPPPPLVIKERFSNVTARTGGCGVEDMTSLSRQTVVTARQTTSTVDLLHCRPNGMILLCVLSCVVLCMVVALAGSSEGSFSSKSSL
jgi:hypothetical protein